MLKAETSDQKKWLVIFPALALVSSVILVIRLGFGVWFFLLAVIWIVALLSFWFEWLHNILILKILVFGFFVVTVIFSLLGPVLGIQKAGSGGTTDSNTSSKTYTCADNEIHSKKVASGETVYWKCITAYSTTKTPYTQLIIQVAESITEFPFNQKASTVSTVNDIRLYCLTYKIKGQPEKKNYCSSFSDYTGQMFGCNSPEACYQKNNTANSPWIMPFIPNTIVGGVYPSIDQYVSGIKSIEQLIIYPVGGFNSEGRTDQEQAPMKYQPLKIINLN